MTEYDYSPEAYERYVRTQNFVASWVHHTEQHRQAFEAAAPGAPGIPPLPRARSPPLEYDEYYPTSRGQHRPPSAPPSSYTKHTAYNHRHHHHRAPPSSRSDESAVYVHHPPPPQTRRARQLPTPIYAASPPPVLHPAPPPLQSYPTPAVVIVDGSSSRKKRRHRQSQSHARTRALPPHPVLSPIYTSSAYYHPPGYTYMYPEPTNSGRPVISQHEPPIPSQPNIQNGKRPFHHLERPLTPPLTPSRATSSSSSSSASDPRSPANRISLPNLPQSTPGIESTLFTSRTPDSPSSYYPPSRTRADRNYVSSGAHRRHHHHQPLPRGSSSSHPITAVASGFDPSIRGPPLHTTHPDRSDNRFHQHHRPYHHNQSNLMDAAHSQPILDILHPQPVHINNAAGIMQQMHHHNTMTMEHTQPHRPGDITVFVPSMSQTQSSEGEDESDGEAGFNANGSHSPNNIASLTHNQTALMRRHSKWLSPSTRRNLDYSWDYPRTRVTPAAAQSSFPWPV